MNKLVEIEGMIIKNKKTILTEQFDKRASRMVRQAGSKKKTMNFMMDALKKKNTFDGSSIKKDEDGKNKTKAFIHSNTISNSITNKIKDITIPQQEESVFVMDGKDDELVESRNLDENNKMIFNHFDAKIQKKLGEIENKMYSNMVRMNDQLNHFHERNIANSDRVQTRLNGIEENLQTLINLNY